MRSFHVALRIGRELLRDRRTLAFMFLAPVIVMTLVYYAVAEDDVAKIGVASRGIARLFDGDLIAELDGDDDVEVVPLAIPDDETDPAVIDRLIRKAILAGAVDGVLYLDERLLVDRFDGKRGRLSIYVEGTRPLTTAAVLSSVAEAMDELAAQLPVVIDASCSAMCADSVNNKAMDLNKIYLYGSDDDRQIDYFLPVLPTFFVFFFTFVISAVTFQRERLQGTLERLAITPISFWEIIVGYVAGFFIFAGAQAVIILAYILALIDFPFGAGQVLSLLVVTTVTMGVALMFGLFASYLAANEFQALQFIPLVLLPQIFLSDIIWPIEGFPTFFRWISLCFPLTHASGAARDIMLRDKPLIDSWPQLLILVGFGLAMFGALALTARAKGKRR
jgi:ABC-2 type transport system permease protein